MIGVKSKGDVGVVVLVSLCVVGGSGGIVGVSE